MSKGLMVLHVTGRKTGNVYHVPVGRHELDGQFMTYGGGAWRNNLRGGAELRVTLGGREHAAHAVLDDDPERVAQVFTTLLDRLGYKKASRLGLKVNVDRPPTPDEIREATRGRTLILITLTNCGLALNHRPQLIRRDGAEDAGMVHHPSGITCVEKHPEAPACSD